MHTLHLVGGIMHALLLLTAYNMFDIMTRCHPHAFVKMLGEVGCIESMHTFDCFVSFPGAGPLPDVG